MPEAGSKTNSVEKLGPTGVGGLGSSSKVMAGLFKVKSWISESKSKAEGLGEAATGLGDAATGLGVTGRG